MKIISHFEPPVVRSLRVTSLSRSLSRSVAVSFRRFLCVLISRRVLVRWLRCVSFRSVIVSFVVWSLLMSFSRRVVRSPCAVSFAHCFCMSFGCCRVVWSLRVTSFRELPCRSVVSLLVMSAFSCRVVRSLRCHFVQLPCRSFGGCVACHFVQLLCRSVVACHFVQGVAVSFGRFVACDVGVQLSCRSVVALRVTSFSCRVVCSVVSFGGCVACHFVQLPCCLFGGCVACHFVQSPCRSLIVFACHLVVAVSFVRWLRCVSFRSVAVSFGGCVACHFVQLPCRSVVALSLRLVAVAFGRCVSLPSVAVSFARSLRCVSLRSVAVSFGNFVASYFLCHSVAVSFSHCIASCRVIRSLRVSRRSVTQSFSCRLVRSFRCL